MGYWGLVRMVMTYVPIDYHKALFDKYLELITHHATEIYNQHADSEFAYFIATSELAYLKLRFSKEVAEDIFTKAIDMAREDKFVNKNGVPYLQGGKDE